MSVSGFARKSIAALFLVSLSACGTTYVIPETGDGVSQQAAQMFSAAQAEPPRKASSLTTAEARFHRVVRRVQPVAEAFCRKEFAEGREIDCNVALELADRAVILDTGSVVFDGSAKEVLGNAELRAEYLAI